MSKTTTTLWAISPQDTSKEKLLAKFVVEDGKVIEHETPDPDMRAHVEEGFYTRDGLITMKDNGEAFVEILGGNYSTSSYILVRID